MMLIRQEALLFLAVYMFFSCVTSALTYRSKQLQQDSGDYKTQYAEASVECKSGQCVKEGRREICNCPGFGNYTRDSCRGFECGSDSKCMWKKGWILNGRWCACKPGFNYNKGECIESCITKPCKNGGICSKEKDFQCQCKYSFYGPYCERNCTCTNGECKFEDGKDVCKCFYGYGNWTNSFCKVCHCGPDSTCIFGEGPRHQKPKKCLCKPGYKEKDGKCIGPCFPNPCQNNGKCKTEGESYKCECKPPFSGVNCEEGPCISNPCRNNGTCLTEGESYKCECKPPFSGMNCEDGIHRCSDKPCQNGGVCIQKENSFSCYCKPPYFGALCEKDPCTKNPCKNGGTCLQIGYSFKCKCSHPFSGDTCQYDACRDSPCFNGGTCIKDGNSFKCNYSKDAFMVLKGEDKQ